jgi:hypothetical protein
MIWKWHIYEKKIIYPYITINYTILLVHTYILLTCKRWFFKIFFLIYNYTMSSWLVHSLILSKAPRKWVWVVILWLHPCIQKVICQSRIALNASYLLSRRYTKCLPKVSKLKKHEITFKFFTSNLFSYVKHVGGFYFGPTCFLIFALVYT